MRKSFARACALHKYAYNLKSWYLIMRVVIIIGCSIIFPFLLLLKQLKNRYRIVSLMLVDNQSQKIFKGSLKPGLMMNHQYLLPKRFKNSSLVLCDSRKYPNIQEVTVEEPVFWTPRDTIHI